VGKKLYIETAVLLITFNRPDLTKELLKKILKYDFKNLIIVSDGPRNFQDRQLVESSRQIIVEIAPKNSEIIFRPANLGCKNNVYISLMEAISKHERLIILEDDCMPGKYFFDYCECMLEKFSDDLRISHISGVNPQDYDSSNDVFLSKYPRIWGWACWRRSLNGFDTRIKFLPRLSRRFSFIDYFLHFYFYYCIHIKKVNTWDYQLLLHILSKGYSIVPKISLVENVGFREDATHTNIDGINYELQASKVDYAELSFSYDMLCKKNDRNFAKFLLPKIIRNYF
jgi:hypothetical protein